MKTRWFACCTLLLLTLCAAGTRAQPSARSDDEARRHYERGLSLYEDGAYDAALGELIRAYELRPAPILLYNIALVHRALNDHAAALQAFRQYVAISGKSLPDARVAEVDAQISELEQRVAQITVQVDVEGAEVLVDQRLVGVSPLREPLLVNAGLRQITVQHRSFPAQNQQLRLAGGDKLEKVFRLASGAAPSATRADASSRSAGRSAERTRVRGLVISWSITGALAASALGCGISALRHDRELADARESLAPDTEQLDADATTTRRLAIATDVLTVATLGAGAFSLWWTLRKPRAGSDRAASALNLRLGPSSVLLRGQY